MGTILKLQPVFKETIWGGTRLKEVFGYDIPSDKTGECWGVSAHKNGDCLIASGPYEGMHLSEIWANHKELFGNDPREEFPILVKIIDANSDLSVQVHPDDKYAKEHENCSGKSECWYVLDTREYTHMVMGHHAKTKEELVHLVEIGDYDALLNIFEIKPGQFFYIPAGTIHAICEGSLIYEAQQSSDITYRVYDYHRKDQFGRERELHVKKSLDVIEVPYVKQDASQFETKETADYQKTTFIRNEFFTVDKIVVKKEVVLKQDAPFAVVSVISGSGKMNDLDIHMGDHYVICTDVLALHISGDLTVMICHL